MSDQQERENMEDARPEEPGTVGDALAQDPGRDPQDPGPDDPGVALEQPDDESGAEE